MEQSNKETLPNSDRQIWNRLNKKSIKDIQGDVLEVFYFKGVDLIKLLDEVTELIKKYKREFEENYRCFGIQNGIVEKSIQII